MPMVLAIVTDTEGSTYSKTGDFILIRGDGQYQGLVSGGCVEGDLAERASAAITAKQCRIVDYDLGGEHDALWGMGAGCDGALQILLVPLTVASGLYAFRALAKAYQKGEQSLLAVAVSDRPDAQLICAIAATGATTGDPLPDWLGKPEALVTSDSRSQRVTAASHAPVCLVAVAPAPSLLICGAAPDVEPICELLATLGWRVTVCDHRPAYLQRLAATGQQVQSVVPGALDDALVLSEFDAVLIMSHHLASDEAYLAEVAGVSHWRYVGLLGPAHRRDRLLAAIGNVPKTFVEKLHGPAGLRLGGREPASIAISIVAELHQALLAN